MTLVTSRGNDYVHRMRVADTYSRLAVLKQRFWGKSVMHLVYTICLCIFFAFLSNSNQTKRNIALLCLFFSQTLIMRIYFKKYESRYIIFQLAVFALSTVLLLRSVFSVNLVPDGLRIFFPRAEHFDFVFGEIVFENEPAKIALSLSYLITTTSFFVFCFMKITRYKCD